MTLIDHDPNLGIFDPTILSSGVQYDMDPVELAMATDRFLTEQPPRSGNRFACYRVSGLEPAADMGRSIERTVFLETFGNNTGTMQNAYGPYEAASTFFITFDTHAKKPVGVLRVIEDSAAGFMTINDMTSGAIKSTKDKPIQLDLANSQLSNVSFSECWDVGTVAVMPEYRAGREQEAAASILLYRALYTSALANDIKHLVSIIDKKAFNQMTRMLGIPFKSLGNTPKIKYLDSKESNAVHGFVPDFYRVMDHHRTHSFLGRAARPLLEKLMDGARATDESLEFFTPGEIAAIRAKSLM